MWEYDIDSLLQQEAHVGGNGQSIFARLLAWHLAASKRGASLEASLSPPGLLGSFAASVLGFHLLDGSEGLLGELRGNKKLIA